MNTSMITIKTDPKIKQQAQKVARDLGLPLSAVINNYLREFADERHVVFSVPLIPNKRTQKIIAQVEKDIKAGKNISPAFSTGKEMDEYLAAQ